MGTPEQGSLLQSGKQSQDCFVFVGDALALDVVNTERLVRGIRRDVLPSPEILTHWWQQAQQQYAYLETEYGDQEVSSVDQGLLEAFKGLRTALRLLFEDMMMERDIQDERLNALNDVLSMGTQVLEQSSPGVFRLKDQPGTLPGARLLLPIVRSAIWLLSEGSRSRLRSCQNPRCCLLFYDRTRSATRQWCCLKCMDRARSARRYQQVKEQRPDV